MYTKTYLICFHTKALATYQMSTKYWSNQMQSLEPRFEHAQQNFNAKQKECQIKTHVCFFQILYMTT